MAFEKFPLAGPLFVIIAVILDKSFQLFGKAPVSSMYAAIIAWMVPMVDSASDDSVLQSWPRKFVVDRADSSPMIVTAIRPSISENPASFVFVMHFFIVLYSCFDLLVYLVCVDWFRLAGFCYCALVCV